MNTFISYVTMFAILFLVEGGGASCPYIPSLIFNGSVIWPNGSAEGRRWALCPSAIEVSLQSCNNSGEAGYFQAGNETECFYNINAMPTFENKVMSNGTPFCLVRAESKNPSVIVEANYFCRRDSAMPKPLFTNISAKIEDNKTIYTFNLSYIKACPHRTRQPVGIIIGISFLLLSCAAGVFYYKRSSDEYDDSGKNDIALN